MTRAIRGPNDELIAHVGIPGYAKTPDVFQNVSDARLIAAAPDLLAVAELAARYTGHECAGKITPCTAAELYGAARAAIAKATGKE